MATLIYGAGIVLAYLLGAATTALLLASGEREDQ